jgi:hypothetical protein
MLEGEGADNPGGTSSSGIRVRNPGDKQRKRRKAWRVPILDYCDACLGPVGPEPYQVTQLEFVTDRVLTWAFCSEECVLSGLND